MKGTDLRLWRPGLSSHVTRPFVDSPGNTRRHSLSLTPEKATLSFSFSALRTNQCHSSTTGWMQVLQLYTVLSVVVLPNTRLGAIGFDPNEMRGGFKRSLVQGLLHLLLESARLEL